MKIYRFSRNGYYYADKSKNREFGDFIVNPTVISNLISLGYDVEMFEIPDKGIEVKVLHIDDVSYNKPIIFSNIDFGNKKQREYTARHLIPGNTYHVKRLNPNKWGEFHNCIELVEVPNKFFACSFFSPA